MSPIHLSYCKWCSLRRLHFWSEEIRNEYRTVEFRLQQHSLRVDVGVLCAINLQVSSVSSWPFIIACTPPVSFQGNWKRHCDKSPIFFIDPVEMLQTDVWSGDNDGSEVWAWGDMTHIKFTRCSVYHQCILNMWEVCTPKPFLFRDQLVCFHQVGFGNINVGDIVFLRTDNHWEEDEDKGTMDCWSRQKSGGTLFQTSPWRWHTCEY